jgi:HEAT repeat protein
MYETYLAALTSGDEALAEQAAGSLTTLPQEQLHAAYEALRAMVDDPEPERRWWAVRALSEIPLHEVPSILAKKLTDTDPEVRQCAALGLRLHPDAAALPVLLELLEADDPILSLLAGEALVVLGSASVPGLLDRLESGSQKGRLMAMRALAEISDPRAVPALFAALDDESMLIEYWANEGLQRMGIGMTFFKP